MNKLLQKLNKLNEEHKLEGYIPINLLTDLEQKKLKELEREKFIKISKAKRWIQLLDYLEFKGYRTNAVYRYKNMDVKIHSFCSQKVWIKKEQKFRIREFAVLKPLDNHWAFLFQLGEEKWI